MRTAIGTSVISGIRISALATVIALGVAAMSPAMALPDEVDQGATSMTAAGTAKVETRAGSIDHVFRMSLSDRLEIKAAVETFVWGLSNRQSSAVWLIAPEVEQTKFGSEDAIYGFFSRVHPPLAHAKSIAFDSISTSNNLPVVNTYVTDSAGLQWQASFAMARDSTGAWKIVSCRLLAAPGDLI